MRFACLLALCCWAAPLSAAEPPEARAAAALAAAKVPPPCPCGCTRGVPCPCDRCDCHGCPCGPDETAARSRAALAVAAARVPRVVARSSPLPSVKRLAWD